jgi:hypothetical protein
MGLGNFSQVFGQKSKSNKMIYDIFAPSSQEGKERVPEDFTSTWLSAHDSQGYLSEFSERKRENVELKLSIFCETKSWETPNHTRTPLFYVFSLVYTVDLLRVCQTQILRTKLPPTPNKNKTTNKKKKTPKEKKKTWKIMQGSVAEPEQEGEEVKLKPLFDNGSL